MGVSRGPLPPGLPGEQSRPKEPSTRRAPRGPSATQPQAAGKGLGEGSGQSGGPATSGEMRGCLTTSPPGAPQKDRRGWLAGRSRADSHLAAPRVPAPPPLRPIRGPAPGSVSPPQPPPRAPGARRALRLAASLAHRGPAASAALPPARVSPLCKESRSRRKVTSHMP